MQIKPVTKADKPEYPTASEIDIPKVLNASKPKKWKRNAAIGAVMVIYLISCNPEHQKVPINKKQNIQVVNQSKPLNIDDTCMLMGDFASPPIYLLEDEAKELITYEFSKDIFLVGEKRFKKLMKKSDVKSADIDKIEFVYYHGKKKYQMSINLMSIDTNSYCYVDLAHPSKSVIISKQKDSDELYFYDETQSLDENIFDTVSTKLKNFIQNYKENKGKK